MIKLTVAQLNLTVGDVAGNVAGMVAAARQAASRELPELAWVFGTPLLRDGPGKQLESGLLVLKGGEVLLRYAKQLLPTCNVFDERRHFETGPDVAKVLRVGAAQVGLLICEDGWNDAGADCRLNPVERLRDAAPDVVISINASPCHAGGHDQPVCDGASFAVEPDTGGVGQGRQMPIAAVFPGALS